MQVAANDQNLVNPPVITDGEVRKAMSKMTQAITSQAQAITAQANREFAPRENHANTMARRLKDFTRMNPLQDFVFYGGE